MSVLFDIRVPLLTTRTRDRPANVSHSHRRQVRPHPSAARGSAGCADRNQPDAVLCRPRPRQVPRFITMMRDTEISRVPTGVKRLPKLRPRDRFARRLPDCVRPAHGQPMVNRDPGRTRASQQPEAEDQRAPAVSRCRRRPLPAAQDSASGPSLTVRRSLARWTGHRDCTGHNGKAGSAGHRDVRGPCCRSCRPVYFNRPTSREKIRGK